MAGGNSGLDPYMIIVGDPCSEFVRTLVRLAQEYEVESVSCDDVYSAVSVIARATGRRALIVGALRDLAREDSRFFQIAEANASRCCCLVEKSTPAGSRSMQMALRSGAWILGDARDVRTALKDWLANGVRRKVRVSLSGLADEDVRATDAELSALLGHRVDG